MLLPYTIEFKANVPDCDTRYLEIAHFLCFSANYIADSTYALVTAIVRLSDDIGQPCSIQSAFIIPRETLTDAMDTLVKHSQADTQFIKAARSADNEVVKGLFLAAYHGNKIDW